MGPGVAGAFGRNPAASSWCVKVSQNQVSGQFPSSPSSGMPEG